MAHPARPVCVQEQDLTKCYSNLTSKHVVGGGEKTPCCTSFLCKDQWSYSVQGCTAAGQRDKQTLRFCLGNVGVSRHQGIMRRNNPQTGEYTGDNLGSMQRSGVMEIGTVQGRTVLRLLT